MLCLVPQKFEGKYEEIKLKRKVKVKKKWRKYCFNIIFLIILIIFDFFFLNKIKHGKIIFLILCLILENFEGKYKNIYIYIYIFN